MTSGMRNAGCLGETREGWRLLQMIAISVGFFDVISSVSPRAFHHRNLEAQIGRC